MQNQSFGSNGRFACKNEHRTQSGRAYQHIVYAVGQLIACALCSKFDPKQVVTVGLVTTSFCNLMIGFSDRYLFVLLLWMLNGLSLAFFWPPILQINTNWSEPEEYTKVSILLNLPTTVGFLIAWLGFGMLSDWLKWQWMFWIPSVAAFVFCVIWVWKMYSSPKKQI